MSDQKRLFSKGFSTNRIPVTIPSTGQTILLRETTITELKSICMTVIDNLGRRQMHVIYDAMTEYLQAMILTDGVDVNSFTEFDRIYCLMVFFQMVFFKDPIEFNCPNCNVSIVYQYDMSKYLSRMENAFVEDQTIEIVNKSRVFKVLIGWPSVSMMSRLTNHFYSSLGQVTEQMEQTQYGINFIMSFIKRIDVYGEYGQEDECELSVDLTTLDNFQQNLDILNSLPSKVVFDDEEGIFGKITGFFVNRLENCFEFEVCPQCHRETYYGLGQSSHFYQLFYGSLEGIYGFIKQIECLMVHRYDCFIFQAEGYITYNELSSLIHQIGTTVEKENQERQKGVSKDALVKGLWYIREILNTMVFPEDLKHRH